MQVSCHVKVDKCRSVSYGQLCNDYTFVLNYSCDSLSDFGVFTNISGNRYFYHPQGIDEIGLAFLAQIYVSRHAQCL
jgi:hypothetical protein